MINNLSIIVCDTCKTPGPTAYTAVQARAAAAANGWQTFHSKQGRGDVCPDCLRTPGPKDQPALRVTGGHAHSADRAANR